ncbi:MAG: hypothetical protein ACRDLO_13255 [Solirubrobacterales bacterium]
MRRLTGEVAEGRVVLAHSVPRPGERFAILGAPPVVDADAQTEFEELVGEVTGGRAPAAGPAHDTTLLAAAWCWPEEREHTADGEVVVGQYVDYGLPEPNLALRTLADNPALEANRDGDDEWSTFTFRPPGWSGFDRRPPAPERGVRWKLCGEDAVDRPGLGEISFDHYENELTLHTLTPARLRRAERELRGLLGDLLGEEIARHEDHPDIVRRWQRDRLELRLAPAPEADGHFAVARAA